MSESRIMKGDKVTPTSRFSRIFDLLSQRDPTLNATLYEDAEFAGLVRDTYRALAPKLSEPDLEEILRQSFRDVRPLVERESEGERITSEIMDFRMRLPTANDLAVASMLDLAHEHETKP